MKHFLTVMMVFLGASQCFAQLSSERFAPEIGPSSRYVLLDTRYDWQTRVGSDDHVLSAPAWLELRPIFGAKFYDERLDLRFTVALRKHSGVEAISQRRPESELKLDAWRTLAGATQPYLLAYLPHGGAGTDADLGIRQIGKVPLPFRFGKLEFFHASEIATTASSRAHDAKIRNSSGRPVSEFGLTGDEDENGDVEEPGFKRNAVIKGKLCSGARIEPVRLAGFFAQGSAALKPTYTPKYELHGNGKVYSAYARRILIEHKVEAGLRLAPDLLVASETYWWVEGFYDRPRAAADRGGAPRWESILRLELRLL